ncbi:MAG: hypothetical protein ACLGG0_13590 [Bacteriovoracia bacterium]
MLSKYAFELVLERVAEKLYAHGASQRGEKRGGNSVDTIKGYGELFGVDYKGSTDTLDEAINIPQWLRSRL